MTNVDCGVYCITNKLNNKIYIGSSKEIRTRWKKHTYKLGDSKTSAINKAILKYGTQNFNFVILELCAENHLKEVEQMWIDAAQPFGNRGYNINKRVDRPITSVDTTVYQLCARTGNVIKKFKSVTKASKGTNISNCNISRASRGLRKTAGGYMWSTSGLPLFAPNSEEFYGKVICTNTTTGTTDIFETIDDAAKTTNTRKSRILEICKGSTNRRSSNGLSWEFYT